MPPGKTLTSMLEMKEQTFEKLSFKPQKENLVHAVIFVHAATDPIPRELLSAVTKAIHPDKEGQRSKFVLRP